MKFFIGTMPSILVLLSAVAASVYHVDGAATVMVDVKCLQEEGKESKCLGATQMTTPSPMYLNGELASAGGYSWDYEFVNALLDEGGIEIGETDYNVVSRFITQEKLKVHITDEGQCTITVNGTETCRMCQSVEVGCFDGDHSQVQYDCTNLPMGKASLDECVPLNPEVDPLFYPFELEDADEYFSYEYTVKDPNANVYRYDSELPQCFTEPKLIRQDSTTVPMCIYDSNFLSIQEMNGSSATVKVNDIWSTTKMGIIPYTTQVFVHTNGVDSVLRNETSADFQCANKDGNKLTIEPGVGSENFEVQCVQRTPDSPFLATIDLVISDDIIMGSNEVGHPCYDHYEPIFQSCSYRLVIPCSQDEICPASSEAVAGSMAATRAGLRGGDVDDELCPGKSRVETDLDLYNAVVTNNTLHLPGGKLEYQNVGTVRGKDVNLEVTVYDGEYRTNAEAALLKNGKGKDENGNWGEGAFGNIHMTTVHGEADSGEASFEFCFRDSESNDLVTVDSFQWTVYDLDERNDCRQCIKEKFIIDTRQAVDYVMTEDTEVQSFCESYTLWPHNSLDADPPSPQMNCPAGDRTVFHSSTAGTGADNPDNKDDMTRQQLKRSVQFTFKDTSCFHFTYNHYCPPTEAGDDTPCGWYGGGNFLFAGSAAQLIEEGECITSSPTTSPSPTKDPTASPTTSAPTKDPTVSPTLSPTKTPTVEPTKSPTVSPTASPTKSPTVEPTKNPTASPTKSPTASPTKAPTMAPTTSAPTNAPSAAPSGSFFPSANPTDSPSKSMSPTLTPTDAPTKSPTKNPTASPTKSPTVEPTKNPTLSPTKSPTVGPTKNPTASPTASPTKNPTSAPTNAPSAAPSGSFFPSANPTDYPSKSMSPTLTPTDAPTKSPTKNPTASPTKSPTVEPTKNPTLSPTKSPTAGPTKNPTASPTASPTKNPTSAPTNAPSAAPSGSFFPSANPTDSPSKSMSPTLTPTDAPTKSPTKNPTASPTKSPTVEPTKNPTLSPTKSPTAGPTKNPTASPTASPTKNPTSAPTNAPSAAPSGSFYPSSNPTDSPSKSMSPSLSPTDVPTKSPTPGPTKNPTASPTKSPTLEPTKNPTASPTAPPTLEPTKSPTASPTANPTAATLSPTKPISEGNTKPPSPIVLPDCPEDVVLLHHHGETEIDLNRVVRVVSQDRSTVTVALTQGWDPVVEDLYVNNNDYYYNNEDKPIDHIFYSYRIDHFDEKCFEETSVNTDEEFATIEISCSVTKPYALLEVCVVDNLEHGFLTSKDDASVPKCCEPEFPPETPTVCYTIEIKCVSECLDNAAPFRPRGLRGALN